MTAEEINRKIDSLAKKRDHCADVLGKPLLALSYQQEIDRWVEQLARLAVQQSAAPSDADKA